MNLNCKNIFKAPRPLNPVLNKRLKDTQLNI